MEQRNYKQRDGFYGKNINDLDLKMNQLAGFSWSVKIEITGNGYSAKIHEINGNRFVFIQVVGKVWVEKGE